MLRLLPSVVVLVAISFLGAFADLPPPRDIYAGPRHATLGGLAFEHRVTHYSWTLRLHRENSIVILTGCVGKSENCSLVIETGVTDWSKTGSKRHRDRLLWRRVESEGIRDYEYWESKWHR